MLVNNILDESVFDLEVDEDYLDSLSIPQQIEYIRRLWASSPEYMGGRLREWLAKQSPAVRGAVIALNPLAALFPMTTTAGVAIETVKTVQQQQQQSDQIKKLQKQVSELSLPPLEPVADTLIPGVTPGGIDIAGLVKNPIFIGGAILAGLLLLRAVGGRK